MKVYRWEDKNGEGPLSGTRSGYRGSLRTHRGPTEDNNTDLTAFVNRNFGVQGLTGKWLYCYAATDISWLIDLTYSCIHLIEGGFELKEFEVKEDYRLFDYGNQIVFNRDLATITAIVDSKDSYKE